MIFLKSILAGIAGSILGIVLLAIAIISSRITNESISGTIWVRILPFLPLAMTLLGFAAGFYLMFQRLSRRAQRLTRPIEKV
jgi:hypothetical protein